VDRLRRLVPEEEVQVVLPPEETTTPETSSTSEAFVNLQRNLNYARSLATAGQHLAQLQVGSFEVADVFRAAWVQSVAALDHWVRQEVQERMLRLAQKPDAIKPKGFNAFPVTMGILEQVQSGSVVLVDALAGHLRESLGRVTYQHPDKIRDGFALVGNVEKFWDRVAKVLSEEGGEGTVVSGSQVHERLRDVVQRRNKIAHEYDEDPDRPPTKRPIDSATATETIDWIEQTAAAILIVLDQS
jgi:hypothetical protein